VGNGDGGVSDSDRGDVGRDNRGGGVGLIGGSVDMGLLNNLMDGVHLVGSGDSDGPGDLNVVGLGHVLGDDDISVDGDGHVDGDIDVVFVHLELGNDVGLDRGDNGVGPDGGGDLPDGDGVSGSGSSWDRCRGDGSQRCRGSGDDGSGQSSGLNEVLGSGGGIRVGRLGDHLLADLVVLVAGLDSLGADLHGLVSNDTVFGVLLDDGGSSGIRVVGLANSHRGGNVRAEVDTGTMDGSAVQGGVGGGTIGAGNERQGDHKSVHLGLCSEETL